jgi:light-regulated signal transduction histidine kinase (bacteriophytochrome)
MNDRLFFDNPVGMARTDREGRLEYLNGPMALHLNLLEEEQVDRFAIEKGEIPPAMKNFISRVCSSPPGSIQQCSCDQKYDDGSDPCLLVGVRAMDDHESRRAFFYFFMKPSSECSGYLGKESDTIKRNKKELERILYVVSHDLRSPLLNLEGWSSVIQESCNNLKEDIADKNNVQEIYREIGRTLNNDVEPALKYISSSVDSMSSLINAMLMISRAGRMRLSVTNIDMDELMDRILDTQSFIAGQKKVVIEKEKLPPCRGDEHMLEQLFSNLLSNAIKYSSEVHEALVRITGNRQDNMTVYCVEDNGIGIDEANLETIFDTFTRHAEIGKGFGVGLSIVRMIARRHGGNVTVRSEKGNGSRFCLHLPDYIPEEEGEP